MTARRVDNECGRRPRIRQYAVLSSRVLARSACGGSRPFAGGWSGITNGTHCPATPRTVIPADRKQCWNVLQTLAHLDPT